MAKNKDSASYGIIGLGRFGTALAKSLAAAGNIEISEIRITQKLVGRSVQEADLRRKFGLNIIAIERGEQTMTDINPAHVFAVDDIIVVVGKNESIQRFEEHLV